MLTVAELQEGLPQFYGTEGYHHFSFLYPRLFLTDGAKWLADSAECYWLMDAIGSHQSKPGVRREYFQTWKLVKAEGNGAYLYCSDGNEKLIEVQHIPYTDFPLDKITLWAIESADERGNPFRVIMLPSEY